MEMKASLDGDGALVAHARAKLQRIDMQSEKRHQMYPASPDRASKS